MARSGEWEETSVRRSGGSRGLREDLSEITRSLARQLRAAADFLAPPPPPRPSPAASSSNAIVGVRSDFTEIGGGFRTGLAAISSLLGSSDRGGGGIRVPGVVGVTEEVLKFVDFLSGRPEEWIQCPVPLDDRFEMTEHRRRHIITIEYLVPSLVTLRTKLCPSQISEGTFWKIYLFLLHPKLGHNDSLQLSTPQIVEEMDRALQDLRNRIIRRLEISRAAADTSATSAAPTNCQNSEIEEVHENPPLPQPNLVGTSSSWMNPIDREDAEITPSRDTKRRLETSSWVNSIEREDVEQWLEGVEIVSSRETRRQLESEEEPMLSDFEGDFLGLRRPMSSSSVEVVQFSNVGGSVEWARPPGRRRKGKPPPTCRRESKAEGESSDWIDAADSDSTFG